MSKSLWEGFPRWQMAVICIIRFSEPIAFTSMFPYVYYMVRDFGVAKSKADIATYCGYLSGSFAFFQFLCSVQWGAASDRWGRKPVLLIGLGGAAASQLLFGFASSFTSALIARSISGSLNGNVAVIRTAVGEIATEKRHQAVAFASIPFLWNIGSIVGPMLGGSKFLTRPKGSPVDFVGPDWYEKFVTKYPYGLSNVVVAVLLLISWVVCFLFLEETHPKLKGKRDIGLQLGNWIRRKLGYIPTGRNTPDTQHLLVPEIESDTQSFVSEYSSILHPRGHYSSMVGDDEALEEDGDDNASINSYPISRRLSTAIIRRYSSNGVQPSLSRMTTRQGWATYSEAFTPAVKQTLTANFLLSFHSVVFSEFLPVFLAGAVAADQLQFPWKIKGGFGYETNTIGTLLSSTGLIGGLNIMLVFPWLDRRFSTKRNYAAASCLFPFIYFAIPYLIFTIPEYTSFFPAGFTKVALYGLCFANVFAVSLSFPNILMLVHSASPPNNRAFINGAALSLGSLARCLGPFIWGNIMAFSEKNSIAWLSWSILAFLAIAVAIQACNMKDYAEDDNDIT